MSAEGNLDRVISDDEARLAGKMAADFMRRMGGHPRELTTYAVSVIIKFMAGSDGVNGEMAIIDELRNLSNLPPLKRS